MLCSHTTAMNIGVRHNTSPCTKQKVLIFHCPFFVILILYLSHSFSPSRSSLSVHAYVEVYVRGHFGDNWVVHFVTSLTCPVCFVSCTHFYDFVGLLTI